MLKIGKQLACQKFIYKIHSSRLRKERWKLTLPMEEARRNNEVISLADSQMLRWIDELNGIADADSAARDIKASIRELRKDKSSPQSRREIRRLYKELDAIQFKPDYMCLIIDKNSDYARACRGFSINGIRYRRLLGTNGGIKNSTIVFVSERLYPELHRRITNGRDESVALVPAKLEAYMALTCSASVPVSFPKGILVVDDAQTEFLSDIIYITDENDGEPVMEYRKDEPVKLNASDGFGLMLPSLAERWSSELELDYTAGGMNTRFSFEKGMVFAFNFVDFAERVAGTHIVKDAWGNDVDIRKVELVLTTSMVKLWDSYPNAEEYMRRSIENGYTFGIAKTCPKELESERALNYQFIQSYDLTDEEIDELISPTVNEIHDVLGNDWRKAILFLRGVGLTEDNADKGEDDFIKAMMADRRVLDDPFVKSSIYHLIRNRINEAKVGVINVHGNFSIVGGDPYLLCQSMFGLEKTGLLKAGEIYNKYWADCGAERLACFRAPMTCHDNIRSVRVVDNEEVRYWYKHMNTSTVFNAWDTSTAALNGCDFDGDLVLLTDNSVLVRKMKELPALMCVQRKAEKKIPTEADLITSNIESFGNDIGQTTNWITSMFEVKSHFDPDSEECRVLDYRIRCGQLYQQNAIDKAKGIICKPMPKEWHDKYAAAKRDEEIGVCANRPIVADRKPYFMKYIYPDLMRKYSTYIRNTDRKALRAFQMSVRELEQRDADDQTEEQKTFLSFFHRRMPVGLGDCVMNRICRRFEEEFDGIVSRSQASKTFDYSFMRSDADYTPKQMSDIKHLRDEYGRRINNYAVFADYERVDDIDSAAALNEMNEEFLRECSIICPDRDALCNIVLDLCYTRSSTKRFAWAMCGSDIIRNLLSRNGGEISYPSADPDGDIEYAGQRFSIKTKRLEEYK